MILSSNTNDKVAFMLKPSTEQRPTDMPYSSPYLSSGANFSQTQPYQQVSGEMITYNHITYALAMFSYFTVGLTWIIPIVMNYLKRDTARGTWLYSHFDWQIKTFWYTVFFGGIAIVLMVFGFSGSLIGLLTGSVTIVGSTSLLGLSGLLLLGLVVVWHFYRMVRGWIALSNRRPVP